MARRGGKGTRGFPRGINLTTKMTERIREQRLLMYREERARGEREESLLPL